MRTGAPWDEGTPGWIGVWGQLGDTPRWSSISPRSFPRRDRSTPRWGHAVTGTPIPPTPKPKDCPHRVPHSGDLTLCPEGDVGATDGGVQPVHLVGRGRGGPGGGRPFGEEHGTLSRSGGPPEPQKLVRSMGSRGGGSAPRAGQSQPLVRHRQYFGTGRRGPILPREVVGGSGGCGAPQWVPRNFGVLRRQAPPAEGRAGPAGAVRLLGGEGDRDREVGWGGGNGVCVSPPPLDPPISYFWGSGAIGPEGLELSREFVHFGHRRVQFHLFQVHVLHGQSWGGGRQ